MVERAADGPGRAVGAAEPVRGAAAALSKHDIAEIDAEVRAALTEIGEA
jgi:hypothetical protein